MASGNVNPDFKAATQGDGYALLIPSDRSGILIGGQGMSQNGETPAFDCLVKRSLTTGAALAGFTPPTITDTSYALVNSLVEDSTGRIIVGGNFDSYSGAAVSNLVGIKQDCTLDETWIGCNPNDEVMQVVELAGGGFIICGRFTSIDATAISRVARLNADGSLDSSFTPPTIDRVINAVAALSDGSVVCGGDQSTVGGSAWLGPFKLDSTGAHVTEWDPQVAYGGSRPEIVGVTALAGDGVLVCGEFSSVGGTPATLVVRLLSDGTLDPSYTPPTDTNGAADAAAVQDDGKIVVVGALESVHNVTMRNAVRLNADGTLDETWTDPAISWSYTRALLLDKDGVYITAQQAWWPVIEAYEATFLLESDWPPPDPSDVVVVHIDSTTILASTAEVRPRVLLREVAAFVSSQRTPYEGTATLADTAVLDDELTFLLTVAMEEGFVLADTAEANWTALARVMARLLASGHAGSYVEALAQVLDTVVLAALADAMQRGDLADTVVLSDAVGALYHAFARILERVIASDALIGTNTAFVLLRDSAALGGEVASTVDLVAALRDGAGFAANLSIDNGEYIAWVVNTEGDKPVSRYTQWPFNSMAKVGGRYMACDATGLHWMEGGDDSGEAIRARLRTGLSAMGTRRLKRVPEAFVAYRSDGTLLLWLIQADEETGEKVAGKFLLTPRPAQTTRENRFTPGRGWKAVEFDFIVENVDGADFDLTSLEFRPLYLDRRTRG